MGIIESKFDSLEARYRELETLLCSQEVLADSNRVRDLSRERSSLDESIACYSEYKKAKSELSEMEALSKTEKDPEMSRYVQSEKERLTEVLNQLEQKLTILLLPKDKNDGKNIFMEIRAGTGGEEAALFAAELLRMYTRYAEQQGWKTELVNLNNTGLGGVKEAIVSIQGREAWKRLKFESGVHRVQRVPHTESSGRVHTSTATVMVLPEVEDFEVVINEGDLKIDTYRASGAGGQHVNKTESAIRITHLPTGYVITCQDERSQRQNREKAMRVLRAHLHDEMLRKQQEAQGKLRKEQVGTGDRSEKIRTYNFPQSRITDHRAGFSVHNIPEVMDGDLSDLTENLQKWEREELLKTAG